MSETLSQRDLRWYKIRLGWGSKNTTTIGSHGCTITCIAMLAGLTPDVVNQLFIDHQVYAESSKDVFNIVNWTRIHLAIPWLQFEWRGYSYEPERIKAAASKNGICLVEVDFDGIVATPNDRHWVAYIGNKQIEDPWPWPIMGPEPTSKYPLWKGYSIINKIGEAPQIEEGENMSYQRFYEKFIEAYRKHKDDLDWGEDKNKPESVILEDDAVIGRMIDSLARDKKAKEERIRQLESQPAEVKEVIKEVPVEVIKEVPVAGEGFPKEINGLKLDKVIYRV